MVGDDSTLARSRIILQLPLLLCGALLVCGSAAAQGLYKYRGENGEWIYADRPPQDGGKVEFRNRGSSGSPGSVSVAQSLGASGLEITAANSFYAPVELALIFDSIEGVAYPPPDEDRRWTVPPRSVLTLLTLPLLEDVGAPSIDYRYGYLPGDPAAEPDPAATYRLPYAAGTTHVVTQTYPESDTHRTRDSMYAVDFGMPVGTNVVAARAGVVFDVASTNFKGGPDRQQYADLANLVRILHDDGSFAVYAHLNWNTIRVRPGDRVAVGEYIADSGNTGFSSGPHLHFAVQRNAGMRIESLPVTFRGAGGRELSPSTGARLTAYP
jgi:murein DD-endopeptidase MepM/ murein hydrolase activator NlpD